MTGFVPIPPLVIGLVGGVASGKSTVAKLFEARGLCRIDADEEARAAAGRPEVRAAIRARFGDAVFSHDGSLDRRGLAAQVFDDPRARADLEAITHPAIRSAICGRIERAIAGGESVLLDVPLLLERGLHARCDAIVFVDAPDAERGRRAQGRGWDDGEIRRREQSQLPLAVKKARSTATIDNAGDLDRTRDQVARLLAAWALVRPQRRPESTP